jgi:L-iditol 2-dehydrogenase
MATLPTLFGHEFAGTIEAVGENTPGWKVGDRVAVANSAPCGECFYCRRDHAELCEDLLFLNGAYAERVIVPTRIVAKNMVKIPDFLPFEQAAMAEPLACVVRGMEEVPIYWGETVVVLGTGPIGLMFIALCKAVGARVLAVGRRPERLQMAEALGADEVFNSRETTNLTGAVRARTEGKRGADKVIEAVGLPEAWEAAIGMARKAATVNLFGGCPVNTSVSLDTHRIHYDEITLKGTFHHTPQTFRKALELITEGIVPPEAFLRHRAPLSELPEALFAFARGVHPAIKVVIET